MTADQAARQFITDQARRIEAMLTLQHSEPDDDKDPERTAFIEATAYRCEIVARAVWS